MQGLLVVLVPSLVVAAFLVLGGCVLAERWARTRGVALARRRLVDELGTDAVSLTIAERPLVLALLRPGGTRVQVHARDVPVGEGSLLRALEATVHDVRADLRGRALTTGSGTFAATLDERELAGMVRLPGVVSRLEISSRGLRVWTILGVGIDADVLVHDGGLRVVPDPAQLAPLFQLPGVGAFRRTIEGRGLWLELPRLPFDAVVETLRFEAGVAIATGRLGPQHLTLPRRSRPPDQGRPGPG